MTFVFRPESLSGTSRLCDGQVMRGLLSQWTDGILWAKEAKKTGTGAGAFCTGLLAHASGMSQFRCIGRHRQAHLSIAARCSMLGCK